MTCDAYIVNLDTGAMAKWKDVKFSRTWKLHGKMFGIANDGVYSIEGVASSQCSVEIAPNDFKSDFMKRMNYATIDGLGNADVTPIYDGDDGQSQSTQFSDNMRVKFGRGAKGRNLAVRMVSSSPDFRVESINLYPEKLSRRV